MLVVDVLASSDTGPAYFRTLDHVVNAFRQLDR